MRAGFVAIVGRPNVGKSTLLNRLIGQKLAIISPKPQTTRGRILGVITRPDAQVALLDTPGLHTAKGGLNARMVQRALQSLADADLALFLIEAGPPAVDAAARKALDQVKAAGKPTLLVINKIDAVPRAQLLPLIDRWKDLHAWTDVYPLSGVCWYAVPGKDSTTWSTLDREVTITVTVPNSYSGQGQWVIEFSGPVVSSWARGLAGFVYWSGL